jgi:hypothetical protein
MKGVFSILIFALSLFSGLLSHAEDAYNCEDPKCQQEKTRLSNPTTMNAQFLSRGIPCETGACFKDADSDLGFDVTPLINVEGTATVGPRVSPADLVK